MRCPAPSTSQPLHVQVQDIVDAFIAKLCGLKYTHRPDIHDRDALEANFREKFQRLNAVTLSDSEFARLLDKLITPNVFTTSRTLREHNSYTRDYRHHRYDVISFINWQRLHEAHLLLDAAAVPNVESPTSFEV